MYITKNTINGIFSFLPILANYKKKEIPEKVKKSIKYIEENNKYYQIYEEITNQIYYRLTTTNKEFKWNLKEYGKFKDYVKKLELIDVVGPSILKCLNTPNTEIYNELIKLSEKVDWYPEGDRIKDIATNKYIYQLREINHMDCYFVIKKITSQALSLFSRYIKKISEVTDDLTSEINYILENMEYEFYNIDEEFKYLEEFPLFYDIYLNIKKRINIQLIRCLQNEVKNKKEKENYLIENYTKHQNKKKNIIHIKFEKAIREQKRRIK